MLLAGKRLKNVSHIIGFIGSLNSFKQANQMRFNSRFLKTEKRMKIKITIPKEETIYYNTFSQYMSRLFAACKKSFAVHALYC